MSFLGWLSITWFALRELGYRRVGLYILYRLGVVSGWARWRIRPSLRSEKKTSQDSILQPIIRIPSPIELDRILGKKGVDALIEEANEIVQGNVRLFGKTPIPLNLKSPDPLKYWTYYESHLKAESLQPQDDIRWIWEHARFGWVFCLARAYHLSGDENYPKAFWKYAEQFLVENPPYFGLHWVSAQEVALRLIAFVFAGQVFRDSPHTTQNRLRWLSLAVVWHAERIPPTMLYSRAQNNNHLLSESAGLFTAALTLPGHPHAPRWRRLGWSWFQRGLREQISSEGVYCQHSNNYHRMMLQLALWVHALAIVRGDEFPRESMERLRVATRWLLALCDPISGRTPNLGANDSSHILPLSSCPAEDYRPVLQTAFLAFNSHSVFPSGRWDEEALWMGVGSQILDEGSSQTSNFDEPQTISEPIVLRIPQLNSWAYLRCASFHSRPAHADQLHLDLWWQGLNIAQDAGSYLYNAIPPWDNSLARTAVHNTLTIAGQDQMIRVSRFLWQKWAQGTLLERQRLDQDSEECVIVAHNGYRRLSVAHHRAVAAYQDGRWEIIDRVVAARNSQISSLRVEVHWLLPDWKWELVHRDNRSISLGVETPLGKISLELSSDRMNSTSDKGQGLTFCIARAGELIAGESVVARYWGWASPTYGYLEPALSIRAGLWSKPPITLNSVWRLPLIPQGEVKVDAD